MEARTMMALNENSQGHVYNDTVSQILDRKWAWLMEGVTGKWERRQLSRLLENQMWHLKDEMRKTGILTEATTASAIPDYVKFVFPLVRRVWANLFANGLVSVQSMSGPIGGVFFWEYKYGTSKGTVTAGQNMIENFDRFYSSERVYHELIATGNGSTANYTGTLAWFPVKPYDAFGQVGIEFTTVVGGSAERIYDADGSGTLTGGSSGTITYATGQYNITFSANVDNLAAIYANYFFNMESASSKVPEMNIDISLQPVQAWSRKIKALWSAESADDLRAMLGMDIEGELVGGLASEVALEIDREIVQDLYVAASAGTNIGAFDATVPAGRSPVEHYSGIMTQFDKVATTIHTRTKRGPGNFIVCAPDVNTVISALARHGDFKAVVRDNVPLQGGGGMGTGGRPGFPLPQAPSGYGIYTSGTLQNKWRVIVDPYFPAGKALVGLKGTSFLDSGYAYAPYVPLQVTSTFLDPANFQAKKGLRTRYATKLLNSNFYGVVNVTNTP